VKFIFKNLFKAQFVKLINKYRFSYNWVQSNPNVLFATILGNNQVPQKWLRAEFMHLYYIDSQETFLQKAQSNSY